MIVKKLRINCNRSAVWYFKRCIERRAHSLASKSPEPSYLHNVGTSPLVYKTIGDLLRSSSEKYSNRDAVIFREEKKKLTFQELNEMVDNFAVGLLQIGLKKGDKVAIWGPNTMEWYISFFGAAKVGIISVLINPYYTLPELEYSLQKAKASSIISPVSHKNTKYYEMITKIRSVKVENIITTGDETLSNTIQWTKMLHSGKNSDSKLLKEESAKVLPDDDICIQFTSGTTGKSKAAVVSHFGFVNNSLNIARRFELFERPQKLCLSSPLFHAFATVIVACPALHSGSTLILPSISYDPPKILQAIAEERCTFVNGTPTMFVDLVKTQRERQFDLSSLETAVCGGAPCSPALFKDMKSILGLKKVQSVYGLTEITAVAFQSLPGEEYSQTLDTVGCLQDHLEAKIIDENGTLVPFGTPGELCIRGYSTMKEYFDDPEKSLETKGRDNWLKTGDQFILHKNGYGQIVGRLKEMIIRGGENIFPVEIENILNAHPEILDSQVIGVNDERLGEEVAVCLRVNSNAKITQEDVQSFCRGKIAKFKIPKYVKIMDNFPKTPSGKVQKHKLKETFLKM